MERKRGRGELLRRFRLKLIQRKANLLQPLAVRLLLMSTAIPGIDMGLELDSRFVFHTCDSKYDLITFECWQLSVLPPLPN